MPDSIYPRVRHQRELRQILAEPVCGICKHFPIEASRSFYCTIYDERRYRNAQVPKLFGSKIRTPFCFVPMSEKEYIALLEYKHECKLKNKRKWNSLHPDYVRAYGRTETHKRNNRLYKRRHKEQIKERDKKYRDEHKEELDAYAKQYRETHRELINERARARYAANIERERARHRDNERRLKEERKLDKQKEGL